MLLGLALTTAPMLAGAQTAAPAPLSDPAQQLAQLTLAEQTARESGDAALTLSTSRQLAALALRLLGDLDVAQARLSSARAQYTQSLALDDRIDTRLKLASSEMLDAKPDAALAECATITAAHTADEQQASQVDRTIAQAYFAKNDARSAADALTHAWGTRPAIETGALLITADLRAGRPDHASLVAGQILAKTGESASLHLLLANAYHAAGDVNGTIAELTRSIALAPDLGPVHLALGEAFWELNEYQYNAESLREFTEAQRLNTADYFSNFDLGSILSEYQRYDDASPYLQRASESNATLPDPWLQLGVNAYAQSRAAEARADLEKAIALTGKAESRNNYQIRRAYVILSRISLEQGLSSDAAQLAAHADAIHARLLDRNVPQNLSESTSVTANLAGGSSRRSTATNTAADPDSTPPLEQQRQLRARLQAVLANSLNDAGTALARGHDYTAALPYFRLASAADPSSSVALRNFGLAAFHVGSFDEAIAALTRVVQGNPEDKLAQADLDQARAASTPAVAAPASVKP